MGTKKREPQVYLGTSIFLGDATNAAMIHATFDEDGDLTLEQDGNTIFISANAVHLFKRGIRDMRVGILA